MSRPNLLVVCPPDHYSLQYLAPLRESTDISVSNDEAEVQSLALRAEVILYSGLTGKALPLSKIWPFARSVRWVHSLSAGVEKVLFPELRQSPVPVTNARGVFKRSLAEFAILGMLFHFKKVRRLVESQRNHRWDDFSVHFLKDRTMGVVGYGEIGRECALLAHALGVKISAVRRNPDKSANDPILDRVFALDELAEMLAKVDVLVCAAPLTPETHHMISNPQFASMRPESIVINLGRGPVIDEAALVNALQTKRVAGAALDVFEEEPLPQSSPLWDMDNVLISPHCTDRTVDPDWLGLSMQFFVENFNRYVSGKELENVVDKKAGY